MTAKPYLLLDVDGVLCPFRGTDILALQASSYPGYEYHDGARIHINAENGVRIRRLMESFKVVWATGWGEDANAVISPLHGLPQFPVMPVEILSPGGIHWKQAAIEAYVPDGVPYAFLDDDIDDRGWAYAAEREAPTLWLPTKCYEGITDRHVEDLEAFAQTCETYLRASLS